MNHDDDDDEPLSRAPSHSRNDLPLLMWIEQHDPYVHMDLRLIAGIEGSEFQATSRPSGTLCLLFRLIMHAKYICTHTHISLGFFNWFTCQREGATMHSLIHILTHICMESMGTGNRLVVRGGWAPSHSLSEPGTSPSKKWSSRMQLHVERFSESLTIR